MSEPGPRRRAWEMLKLRLDRLFAERSQFDLDVASWNENHPECEPFVTTVWPLIPELPPMPSYEE